MKPTLSWFAAAPLALLSLSCSDAAPTPATVGLTISISPPSNPPSGTTCVTTGTTKGIGNPAPTPTQPGTRITDGDNEVDVSCKVSGKDTFSVSASIEQGKAIKFDIVGGTINKANGTGTFTASLYTPESLGLSSDAATNCVFELANPPLEVKPATLYANWRCPLMTAAPSTACKADGTIVLEFCEE